MSIRCRKRQPVKRWWRHRRAPPGHRRKLYQPRRPKVYRRRIHPLDEYPRPDEFQKRFRLPPEQVKELAADFGRSSACKSRGTGRGGGLSYEDKVCLALRYMATGANYQVLADTQGVSRTTVTRSVNEFVAYLYSHRKQYIHFPKEYELHETAARFAAVHKFGLAVGCVDGTYIPIQRPLRNEPAYICRHGYHALNCMVVSDAEQRFTYVEPGMSGCNHDLTCWRTTDFGCKVTDTNRLLDYVLLGDGGYGASKHMLVPFKGDELNNMEPWERRYQDRHTATRSSVERAIGQLKTRWRCLSKSGSGIIKKEPLQASWLFVACCVLHNLCVDRGVSKLSRLNNQDPNIEREIQRTARRRFRRAVRNISEDDVPSVPPRTPTGSNYQEGLAKRAEVMFRHFGGPHPRAVQKRNMRKRKQVYRARSATVESC